MSSELPSDPSDPSLLDDDALGRLLVEETNKRTGFKPHDWQVRVAVAVIRRKDVLCLAGTGFGKTLTFIMALFVCKKMVIWIVSPLNYIEEQQVKAFRAWNISAVAVNRNSDFASVKGVSKPIQQLYWYFEFAHMYYIN